MAIQQDTSKLLTAALLVSPWNVLLSESQGQTIGPNDLIIAAIALTHGLTLVSNNREFGRVVGMQVEDWTIPG